MTITEFEDALHSLVMTASGLAGSSVCFSHLPGPAPQSGVYARVERPTLRRHGGVRLVRDAAVPAPGTEIEVSESSLYRADVRVQFYGAGAFGLAAQTDCELRQSDVVAAADALGISVSESSISHVPTLFETGHQDRAAINLVAWFWMTRARATTYIETVYGEGTVTGLPPMPFGPIGLTGD